MHLKHHTGDASMIYSCIYHACITARFSFVMGVPPVIRWATQAESLRPSLSCEQILALHKATWKQTHTMGLNNHMFFNKQMLAGKSHGGATHTFDYPSLANHVLIEKIWFASIRKNLLFHRFGFCCKIEK